MLTLNFREGNLSQHLVFSSLGHSKSVHGAHMAAEYCEWQLIELLLSTPRLIVFIPFLFE